MPIEFQFLDFLQTLHSDVLNTVMICITTMGDNGYVWIALALILLMTRKFRPLGICIALALIIDLVCVEFIIKPLIQRARPFSVRELELLIEAPSGFSFPSGHTASSFAVSTVLFLNNKKAGLAALVLACLIAFSRMYLYFHFPTDILGGIIFGILFGLAAVKLYCFLAELLNRRAVQK